ncbi:tetratricopeptide repeat protein [Thiofilum flexile]|uniref:tetratricopeptide repeat protein n=1 Tax=Thiofilum flexile TaxID=125627 RepID=UPI00037BFA55|nr:tetratricopeptide repeat protein [Thiofilum flexile]
MTKVLLGSYHYDLQQQQLLDTQNHVCPLRQQSLSVLHQLVICANTVVSKQQLFSEVWSEVYVTDDSLVQCIADIRRALHDHNHEILQTIPRRGYLLIAKPINTSVNHSTNLPEDLLPFLGRTTELNDLQQRLKDSGCRLLTLLGLGGVGKSRLAKAVAKCLIGQFEHGVWWVELAPVQHPDLIPLAIANAMGISLQGKRSPLAQLQYTLGKQQCLLVLDNMEHLLPENGVCQALLETNPNLKILVTSRLLLHIYGEWLYPLAGLKAFDYEEDAGYELFLHTAKRLSPQRTFSLDEQQAIQAICNLVDGLPLGIEIAASWVRCLSCHEILQELQRYFQTVGVQTTEAISAPALDTVLQQSWQMLSTHEQHIMQGLSLFRGRFSREAAANVTGANLNDVRNLMDKSMLSRALDGQFALHEVMRQYSSARRFQRQPLLSMKRFVDYHLELATSVDTGILGQQQLSGIARLESEHDNFRECFHLCSTYHNTDLVQQGLKLAGALGMFWFLANHWQEGYRCSEQFLALNQTMSSHLDQARVAIVAGGIAALSDQHEIAERYLIHGTEVVKRQGESVSLARGLVALGVLRRLQGRYQDALACGEQGKQLFTELGDQGGYQLNLVNIGHSLLGLGQYDRAVEALEQGIALHQQLGVTLSLPYALVNLGRVHWQQQQTKLARAYLQQSLEVTEKLGMLLYRAQAHCMLGWIELHDHNPALALQCFKQSLNDYLRLGDQAGQVEVMRGIGVAKVELGELRQAWQFIVLAEHLIERLNIPLLSNHQTQLNEAKQRIQLGLNQKELELHRNLALIQGLDGLII